MRITALQTSGVKSGTTSIHELAPVTIVTGENFAGKTAKLDAIRLGLIGYLPELGKRPSDTFALAANGSMSVRLSFDTGAVLERSWSMKGNSVKATSSGDVAVPAVLIDPAEYFGLGDKDRVRYVFKLAAAHVEGAADAVISRLKAIKVDGHNERHETAINELVNLVDDTDRARHESDKPVPQWLEELIAGVRERLKLSKAEVDRMSKTVGGMAVIDCQDDEAAARNVSHELAAKREQHSALQEERGKLMAERNTLEGAANRRQALQARLAVDITPVTPIEDLMAKLKGVSDKASAPRKTAEAMAKLGEAKRAEATARAMRDNASNAIERTMDELEVKKRAEQCPFCGAKGEGWMDHLLASYDQKIKAEQADLAEREGALQKAAKALRTAETAVTKAKEHDTQIDQAAQEATSIRAQISAIEQAGERRKADIEALAALPTGDIEAVRQKLAAMCEKADALLGEISRLSQQHDKFIQQRQAAVLAAKAAERSEQVKAAAVVEAEALSLLEALQVEMVKEAFGAILGTANVLTEGILKGRLDYNNGEIGRWDSGIWISHHSFSGTEKALAYAGISVALAMQSPVKIVLLDEMGRLTEENKSKVVVRLVELIKQGVIDQAVCVDVSDKGYPAPVEVGFIRL